MSANPKEELIDFNDAKDHYSATIENSIRFAGKGHDYYTQAKAETLKHAVAKYLPHLNNPSLLDVGCGHGLIHPYLKDDFAITGTDVAGEVLDLARRDNPGITYVPNDMTSLPFPDASFDVAMAICVMHHVPPAVWVAFLAEMKRVVKPGGAVFIFEHNPLNPVTRYIVANCELDRGVTLISQWKLQNLMAQAGLNDAKSENILFTPFSIKLDRFLQWCPFGTQYFTMGRV